MTALTQGQFGAFRTLIENTSYLGSAFHGDVLDRMEEAGFKRGGRGYLYTEELDSLKGSLPQNFDESNPEHQAVYLAKAGAILSQRDYVADRLNRIAEYSGIDVGLLSSNLGLTHIVDAQGYEILTGTEGNDRHGTGGDKYRFDAGSGDDRLIHNSGEVIMTGGAGDDYVSIKPGGSPDIDGKFSTTLDFTDFGQKGRDTIQIMEDREYFISPINVINALAGLKEELEKAPGARDSKIIRESLANAGITVPGNIDLTDIEFHYNEFDNGYNSYKLSLGQSQSDGIER